MSEIVYSHWPLLAVLQLLPLLGAAVVYAMGERTAAVMVGRGVALAELGIAVLAYQQIDAMNAALQLAERLPWLGYHVAADGVTALFVLLGALIVVLMALYELVRGLARPGRLLALILLAEAALMVQLVTLNLLWFVFASCVELSVAAYLIGHW